MLPASSPPALIHFTSHNFTSLHFRLRFFLQVTCIGASNSATRSLDTHPTTPSRLIAFTSPTFRAVFNNSL
ncbi:hypothetical protein E2C01_100529 [Portunus trituberculatus]|uniref:Uncharacterized protein n=1 Tax=Portunus trituberculatus TaxID=210409 RepID=A0A5B7KI69_PORTR|nr:hypothetical protein [Portunus trituberculatus]